MVDFVESLGAAVKSAAPKRPKPKKPKGPRYLKGPFTENRRMRRQRTPGTARRDLMKFRQRIHVAAVKAQREEKARLMKEYRDAHR